MGYNSLKLEPPVLGLAVVLAVDARHDLAGGAHEVHGLVKPGSGIKVIHEAFS